MTNSDLEPKAWGEPDEIMEAEVVPPEVPVDSSRHKATLIAAAIALVVLAALFYWLFIRSSGDISPPEPLEVKEEVADPIVVPVTEIKPNEAQPTIPAIVPATVSLQESDPVVREKAKGFSTHARAIKLLSEGELIRRFVAVCNAIALGESPAKLLDTLALKREMKVKKQDGKIFVDPVSYRRYDELVSLLLSLEAQTCSDLYLSFEPQIEAAFRELGHGESESFLEILKQAVTHLRQTPIPPDRVELVEKTVSYAYADLKLEELNLAQKHFLRLGPAHLRQLQGKIGLMLDALLARKKH